MLHKRLYFFFERPTKSPDKHPEMPSIEQMHPLLHNGQSWMHTRATKPPVPGKTRRPKAHCSKTRFGSVSNWRPPERPSSNFIATTNVFQSDASES
ncbi:hypothetical protein Hanom_Chr10g00962251 [Helianthus anomalus]